MSIVYKILFSLENPKEGFVPLTVYVIGFNRVLIFHHALRIFCVFQFK